MRACYRDDMPESGRASTLWETLTYLNAIDQPLILEIGTSRNVNPKAALTDGWATRVWAWYASVSGGHVVSVDNQARAVANCKTICRDYADHLTAIHADGMEEIAKHTPDLLYMDGAPVPQWNLDVWNNRANDPPLVLIDDIRGLEGWTGHGNPPSWWAQDVGMWGPRGELLVPQMLDQGYTLLFARDHQALLRK